MILLTQIYDRSLSWLGTSTSVKSGGVKLVYGPKPAILAKQCLSTRLCQMFGFNKLSAAMSV
jgi:hypothetical protein